MRASSVGAGLRPALPGRAGLRPAPTEPCTGPAGPSPEANAPTLHAPRSTLHVAQRLAIVDALARELEAKFGPGILYRLARARPKVGAPALSTGSPRLDRATGLGGVPRGRLTLLRGETSSGKTTLAYHLLAEAQRDGGLAALIDGEGSADLEALQACGVDTADLILASPLDACEALEMIEILVRCQALDAVVASELPPARPGLLALGLRRLGAWLKDAPTATILVAGTARWRDGGTAGRRDGAMAGGLSSPCLAVSLSRHLPLAYSASLILESRQLRPLFGPGGEVRGLRVRVEVAKNHQAPPGARVELEIAAGRGLRRAAEALEWGLELGHVRRTLQGLVWDGRVLGRGRDAALEALERRPGLIERLLDACLRPA